MVKRTKGNNVGARPDPAVLGPPVHGLRVDEIGRAERDHEREHVIDGRRHRERQDAQLRAHDLGRDGPRDGGGEAAVHDREDDVETHENRRRVRGTGGDGPGECGRKHADDGAGGAEEDHGPPAKDLVRAPDGEDGARNAGREAVHGHGEGVLDSRLLEEVCLFSQSCQSLNLSSVFCFPFPLLFALFPRVMVRALRQASAELR